MRHIAVSTFILIIYSGYTFSSMFVVKIAGIFEICLILFLIPLVECINYMQPNLRSLWVISKYADNM